MEGKINSREGYWYAKGTRHFYEITTHINNRISSRFEGIVICYEGNEFNLLFKGSIKYL